MNVEEGEHPGEGGGAECCRRMQSVQKKEFEKRFRQIEQSVKRKEEEQKTYVDQLKESISLKDEQIKRKDTEIAHQSKMIEELRDKDRRQILVVQELATELAVARKESNQREQVLRDRQKGRNDQRKKTRVTMEIFRSPYS